ncbi:MAG: 4-alpha-glucanotransferase [Reyranella sp.]|nr:4-alpha-glucanotransferase [Reyranella sp.]MBL6654001.1 4-alpha-glucanotransferase [Reyranella sp.]
MNEDALLAHARNAGFAVDWTDAMGRAQRVRPEALRRLIDAVGSDEVAPGLPPLVTARTGKPIVLPMDVDGPAELLLEDGKTRSIVVRDGALPAISLPGYHRLRFADREVTLAVAPPRCVTLRAIGQDRRLWGVAAQIYSLRRTGDGGIGDAGAVRDLAEAAAKHGADAVALSPVHSLFAHEPGRAGPYSPSSRLFLNPLYADPTATFDATVVPSEEALEQAPLIDWVTAGAAKFARLRRLFDNFAEIDTPLTQDFKAFIQQRGEALVQHAAFEARQAGGPERYHMFLQWLTARSFAAAQQAAKAAGMRIGLVSDIAIGMDRAGSHAWARASDLLMDLSVGAPPDIFNPNGQDWGLTAFSPRALVARGFEPFLATLRAALAHAGGVRIDHVMGLMRLWLIPQGQPATEGAYLAYPLEDLLALLALESHRHGAVVIGEDLGTVPPGFRNRLRRAGIAGMDVLWFERTRLSFRNPSRWRGDAVAMTTTHDLPTVAGWWSGEDIRTRRALRLAGATEEQERERDRPRLWRAFTSAGVADGEPPPAEQSEPAVDAALGFVAQSPAPLMLAPVEDLLGLREQPNLPGTIDEHPNWRRRLRPLARELFEEPAARARADAIARNRQR